MSIREQMTLAAALAVGLATSALWPLYENGSWLLRVLGAILTVMVCGLLTRRSGLPRTLQPLIALLALAGYLVVTFAGATLDYGLVPTGRTLDVLRDLVNAGRADIAAYGPPVPTTKGLVFLTAAGVGGLALVVDLIAVVLDRAAIAGLPLLALFAIPSAVLTDGLGGTPFALGAVGWLGLLLVEGSDRVGRWGTPMRSSVPGTRGEDSSLGRVGRRIGAAAVGLSVVVPLVIPGLDHSLLGGGNGSGSGKGGGSSTTRTYNPLTTLQGQLSLEPALELFQYVTDDPQPDYLRMTTLDKWNGAGWEASTLTAKREGSQVQKGIAVPVGEDGPHRTFNMRVAITDNNLKVYWLPLPFGPRKVDVEGLWLWDPKSQTVFSAKRSTADLPAYDVQASRVIPDRNALSLAAVGSVPPEIRKAYGTQIKVAPYVTALTQSILNGKITQYDKATALQAYFTEAKNGYTYNVNASPATENQDKLEAFLKGKQGFCEQYATAMAAMLRVAGIPSRVAVGFTPGVALSKPGTYSVTTSQAHAWPEAWFAGTGWVRFEPTPAASGATVPAYSTPVRVTPLTTPGSSASPTPGPTATRVQTGRLPNEALDQPTASPGSQGGKVGGVPLWIAVPVLVASLAVTPLLLTLLRRRRRWLTPGPLTAWDQVQDDAADVGHAWHPADSPRTAAAGLLVGRRLPAEAVAALDAVAIAAERARFAPPDRQIGRDLSGDVALLRAALQDHAPARVRLRARYAPPSTLQWALGGIADGLAFVANGFDDAISAVTRPIRKRASATR